MQIEKGGAISNLQLSERIKSISFGVGSAYSGEMWINHDCLSCLNLSELLTMRDEINETIGALLCKKRK